MTWKWDQSAGELTRDGKFVAKGYSGHEAGKNNPAMEGVVATGPIPVGRYKISAPYDSPRVGPYALALDAIDSKPGDDKEERTGRGAFRIHGDSIKAPGTASNGCVILPRVVRETIWKSGDHDFEVIK